MDPLALLLASDLAHTIGREHRYDAAPTTVRASRRAPWLRRLLARR
jgi:hypothetical protein